MPNSPKILSPAVCAGCSRTFQSLSGFHSHLRQRRNDERCLAKYRGYLAGLESYSNSGSEDFLDSESEDFSDSESEDLMDIDINNESGFENCQVADPMEIDAFRPDDGEEGENMNEGENDHSDDLREGASMDQADEEGDGEVLEKDEIAALRHQTERILVDSGSGPKPCVVVRYTEKHRKSRAGSILTHSQTHDDEYASNVNSEGNIWAPFNSKLDWEVARWAKMRGPGSTALSELLGIEGVRDALSISFKTSDELNRVIDTKLPSRPAFVCHHVLVDGEMFEFYARDILECIRSLWRDPDFINKLILEPERQYADNEKKNRMFHDMHTGDWWWETQKRVEGETGCKVATILPLIISSDKTQLTTFRNKSAYPVYLTLGNIPKHIRRKPSRQAQILIAYLPTSKLDHITNHALRRRANANLFHACMTFITEGLQVVGQTGMVVVSGDGAARRGFPVLATYVGDYPEQVLVTLVKTGECPVCDEPRKGMGDPKPARPPRDDTQIREALETVPQGPQIFKKACADAGIKPVQDPFWKNLPFVNIYDSVTPDVLHQLYQGLVKHLISWLRSACGMAEFDARCRRFPPNHNIRLFLKGISSLSRITGTEHDQICRLLLGLVLDIRLPNNLDNQRLIRAVRGVLDFLFLAQYPIHTMETLDALEVALNDFEENRSIFVDLGIRDHFDIPKLHYMRHYIYFFKRYGTADNFNTEYTERLHIDMAKDAYRATNSKNEYPQMTAWLDRRERIMLHEKFIRRRSQPPTNDTAHPTTILPSLVYRRSHHMSLHPTKKSVPLTKIIQEYCAKNFEAALAYFITQYQNPGYTATQVQHAAAYINIPSYRFPIYHRLKFVSSDPFQLDPNKTIVVDSIHVEPERFDTAVVFYTGDRDLVGVQGHCVARIRCIFGFPEVVRKEWFPQGLRFNHFAYVEWFTPFSKAPIDAKSRLFRIKRLYDSSGAQKASIVPIDYIRQSVHLFPKFGPSAPTQWTSANVLDQAEAFYVNPFTDRFSYSTLY